LSADNNWTYTWVELPKFNGDVEIVYTVDEINIPEGYVKSVVDNGDVVITNTLPEEPTPEEPTPEEPTPVPEVTTKKVTKNWAVPEGTVLPESVQVQLYADGVACGEVVLLSADNNWTYTWVELPKFNGDVEIVYTVDEINVPEGYVKSVVDNGDVVITNTLPPAPRPDEEVQIEEDDNNDLPEPKPEIEEVQIEEDDTTVIPQTGRTVIWLLAIAAIALAAYFKLKK
jgi:hypothetical protein